jgi:tetratricopeptide (TPR) repeat protein
MTRWINTWLLMVLSSWLCQAGPALQQPRPQDKPRTPGPTLIRDDQTQQPQEAPADEEVVEPDPIKAERAFEVANYYFKKKLYDAAIMRYREAIRYKPDFAEAKWRFVETLARKQDWRNAADFATGYRKDPNMKDYLDRLAGVQAEAEKHLPPPPPQPKENE